MLLFFTLNLYLNKGGQHILFYEYINVKFGWTI